MAETLGELEQLILPAILRLGSDAYGLSKPGLMQDQTNAEQWEATSSRSAIYTLVRLLFWKACCLTHN